MYRLKSLCRVQNERPHLYNQNNEKKKNKHKILKKKFFFKSQNIYVHFLYFFGINF